MQIRVCMFHCLPVCNWQGIGEPPLLLSVSVLMAIKEAIKAARAQIGLEGNFVLESPATVQRIRQACGDQMSAVVKQQNVEDNPWETGTWAYCYKPVLPNDIYFCSKGCDCVILNTFCDDCQAIQGYEFVSVCIYSFVSLWLDTWKLLF